MADDFVTRHVIFVAGKGYFKEVDDRGMDPKYVPAPSMAKPFVSFSNAEAQAHKLWLASENLQYEIKKVVLRKKVDPVDAAVEQLLASLVTEHGLKYVQLTFQGGTNDRAWALHAVDQNLMGKTGYGRVPSLARLDLDKKLKPKKMTKLTKAPDWLSDEDRSRLEGR